MTTDASIVRHVTFGRQRVSRIEPRVRLDAGGTRLRMRALHVMGHGSARIARALGTSEDTIQRLVRGDARTVSPPLRDAVADLYDVWWDKRAPERTRAERAAAARARRRAAAGNWCAAAALNDNQLDTPGYRPRAGYRPATGTGIAPRHPPARPPARQEEGRVTDHRMNLDLITDMFGLLDRHGYTRGDNEHTGRAILLLGDLARIYEGSQDHPFGPNIAEIPPRPEPVPPEPNRRHAVTVPTGEVKTLISALIIAADYKRDRAEMCADCADQSCPTCEWRLRDAQAYDRAHIQLLQSAEASATAAASHPEPAVGSAADPEAGQ